MLRKTFTIAMLLLFGLVVMAQNKQTLKPVGSALIKKGFSNSEVKPVNLKNPMIIKNSLPLSMNKPTGLIDTISYTEGYTGAYSNFGFFGQDVMMQYFQAPTRMLVKAAGFACYENADAKEVQLKLIKFGNGWTFDSLSTVGVANQGYFPSAGDGFNNIGAFPDEATGDWTSPVGSTNPFGDDYDLWSDVGFGWPIVPVGDAGATKVFQFVEMMNLGFEPEVQAGDLFAVVLTHQGVLSDQLSERIGFWAPNVPGSYPGWKFYENGRSVVGPTPPGDGGWWTREFIWDFVVVVEYLDDLPPTIVSVDELPTTLSTGL